MSDTKRNLIIAGITATTLVSLSLGYYLYQSRRPTSAPASSPSSSGTRKKKHRRSKGANSSSSSSPSEPSLEKPQKLSPVEQSRVLTDKGAKAYREKDYETAFSCYTKSLDVLPSSQGEERKIVFCNRAAVAEKLERYNQVVKDCTNALKIDPHYLKALYRRARSSEKLGKTRNAATDVAHIVILIVSKQQAVDDSLQVKYAEYVDKLVRKIGEEEAVTIFEQKLKRENAIDSMPQGQFCTSYFYSFTEEVPHFREDAKVLLGRVLDSRKAIVQNQTQLDGLEEGSPEYTNVMVKELELKKDLALALKYQKNFLQSAQVYFQVLESPYFDQIADSDTKRVVLEDLGSMYQLCVNSTKALQLLEKALEIAPERVNTLIKIAGVCLERQQLDLASEYYDRAKKIIKAQDEQGTASKNDIANLYFHMGSSTLIADPSNSEVVVSHLENAIKAVPDFAIAYMQLAIAHYNAQNNEVAMENLETSWKAAPELFQAHNYMGEMYMDKGDYANAEKKFDDAIAVDPKGAMPYVNKGALRAAEFMESQSNVHLSEALRMFQKAISVDPKCDLAFMRVGMLYLNMGNLQLAMKNFDQAIELSNTKHDLAEFCTHRAHCRAQVEAQKRILALQQQ